TFIGYSVFSWFLIAAKTGFYNVQRHTGVYRVIRLVFIQMGFYAIIIYAFIGFNQQPGISRQHLLYYFITSFVLVFVFKTLTFLLLLKYRSVFKGNIRNVVFIGKNSKMNQLIKVFKTRTYLG